MIIGIDIGTTSVCAVLLDKSTKRILKTLNTKNPSHLSGKKDFERLQDPDVILDTVVSLADTLFLYAGEGKIGSIGISSQMHGILYTDKDMNALSPLYTWQDARGSEIISDGVSYAEYASEITGGGEKSGYGIVTAFFNERNSLVPDGAKYIMTIGDFVASRLAKASVPIMHVSQAASIGAFSLRALDFDREAIKKLSINPALLPRVTKSAECIGKYRSASVFVSLGDNQASFLGAAGDNSLLVNIGTGSQISFVTDASALDRLSDSSSYELRPYLDGKYLSVGAALCGGYSYAILASFFKKTAELLGKPDADIYSFMESCISKSDLSSDITVDTSFMGTRSDPARRGSISDISPSNFTPSDLIIGFNYGMANELYRLYLDMDDGKERILTCSGNGIKKNQALMKIVEKTFGMPLTLSPAEEDAALGAALFTV